MKTLFLHIGLPKCASSSLQLYFAKNIAEMRAAQLAYPEIFPLGSLVERHYGQGNAYSLAYWALPSAIKELANCPYPEVSIGEVLDMVGNEGSVLLSTEWFVELEKNSLDTIRVCAADRGYQIKVIFTYRNVLSWNFSEMKQSMKFGKISHHSEYAPKNPFSYIEKMIQVFGEHSLVGVNLDRCESVYKEYCRILGVHFDKMTEVQERANVAIRDDCLVFQMECKKNGSVLSQGILAKLSRMLDEWSVPRLCVDGLSAPPSELVAWVRGLAPASVPTVVDPDAVLVLPVDFEGERTLTRGEVFESELLEFRKALLAFRKKLTLSDGPADFNNAINGTLTHLALNGRSWA